MAMLEMAVHAFPKKPGVYTLIVEVAQPIRKKIGKLGFHNFPRGFYTYTGSAIGLRSLNLRTRIKRHLALRKKEHWHIDYLLNSEVTRISAVIYIETHSKIECQIARKLRGLNGGNIIVEGFGSSDCHEGCESHLHYFEINFEELSVKVVELYEAFGSPRLLIFGNE
jgi:Uri superfamily endonuclease